MRAGPRRPLRRPRRCRSRCGPGGAPGFENRRDEPELAKDYWVRNIHNPSLTIYLPPRAKATGTGVVIFPGGGHRLLVFKAEGDEPARFLAGLGVAAFVVKYRLAREEKSPYRLEQHPVRTPTAPSAPCAAARVNGGSTRNG